MAMRFDPSLVPVSIPDTHLNLAWLPAPRAGAAAGCWLRTVAGDAFHAMLRVALLVDGAEAACSAIGEPGRLLLRSTGGAEADLAFAGPDLVLVRGRGCTLRLTLPPMGYNSAVPDGGGWLLNANSSFRMLRVLPRRGRLAVDAPWKVGRCSHVIIEVRPDDGVAEVAIDHFQRFRPSIPFAGTVEECAAGSAACFARFAEAFSDSTETARQAQHLLWSARVPARGPLAASCVLTGMNWCTSAGWKALGMLGFEPGVIAAALGPAHRDAAWRQFAAFLPAQDDVGALPAFINDCLVLRNVLPLPLHGWTLSRMRRRGTDAATLMAIYEPLARWARYLVAARGTERGALTCWHPDEAWGEHPVHAAGHPAPCPLLTTLHAVLCRELAGFCCELGRTADVAEWGALLERDLRGLGHLWRGDGFAAPGTPASGLAAFLPALLGMRLAREQREACIAGLSRLQVPGGFSLAAGGPSHPLFTCLAIDGLRACGDAAGADAAAARLRVACAAHGFPAAFAADGAPLGDPGCTTTAACALAMD